MSQSQMSQPHVMNPKLIANLTEHISYRQKCVVFFGGFDTRESLHAWSSGKLSNVAKATSQDWPELTTGGWCINSCTLVDKNGTPHECVSLELEIDMPPNPKEVPEGTTAEAVLKARMQKILSEIGLPYREDSVVFVRASYAGAPKRSPSPRGR